MNDTLKYKDYTATIHFSTEDETFHGKIIGINDLVVFEGRSVAELKKALKEAVEDYIETCKAVNKEPDRTYKGSFNVRLSAHLHRKAARIAAQKNLTLNEFMKLAISFTIKHEKDMDREIQLQEL